jgi:hypothetical protein
MISKLCLAMPAGKEWFLVILIVVMLVFWIKTLLIISSRKFINEGSKIEWLLIVFLMPVLGVILYNFFGHKQQAL